MDGLFTSSWLLYVLSHEEMKL
ncbi:hypothetical protein MPTK1_2g23285 [Marchantia polymorpha subsp. ruderalis]